MLEQFKFDVKIWSAAGIYNRIDDLNHPHARLLTDFYAGHLERDKTESHSDLFNQMSLSVHIDQDLHNQYYVLFQAGYQTSTLSIWSYEEMAALVRCISSDNHQVEPRITSHEGGLLSIVMQQPAHDYIIKPFIRGLSSEVARTFEVAITKDNRLLTLDLDKDDFAKRVDEWGGMIKNIVRCATVVKGSTQSGVFKIGTLHFRSFLDPEIEREFGV